MHVITTIIVVLFIGYWIGLAVRQLKDESYYSFGITLAIAMYYSILLFKHVLYQK